MNTQDPAPAPEDRAGQPPSRAFTRMNGPSEWHDRVPVPGLGEGWWRMSKHRSDAAAAGRNAKATDHIYIGPSGERFRSLKAAQASLALVAAVGD